MSEPDRDPSCAFDATADALTRATGGRVRGTTAWTLGITGLAVAFALVVGVIGWFLS